MNQCNISVHKSTVEACNTTLSHPIRGTRWHEGGTGFVTASCRPRPCSSLGTLTLDRRLGVRLGPVPSSTPNAQVSTSLYAHSAVHTAHPKSTTASPETKMPTLTRVFWLLVLGGRPVKPVAVSGLRTDANDNNSRAQDGATCVSLVTDVYRQLVSI